MLERLSGTLKFALPGSGQTVGWLSVGGNSNREGGYE
jgi:hypothetical protein